MKEFEKDIYQSVVGIRINEVNLRWTKIQLFFIINSALLAYSGNVDDKKWMISLAISNRSAPRKYAMDILWRCFGR